MKEIIKAALFGVIGVTLCFVLILYKNHWTILFNGSYHQLF